MDLTEQELIMRARNHDEKAFKEIIAKYEQQVAATVISILGYGSEADNIGQVIFIQFFRFSNRFRRDYQIGTYLTCIASTCRIMSSSGRRDIQDFVRKTFKNLARVLERRESTGTNKVNKIVQQGLQKLQPTKY